MQLLAPIQYVLAEPTRGFAEFVQTAGNVNELREENTRLREQIDRLTRETVRLPELERENQDLLAQLNLKRARPESQWVTAKVIYYDPSNLSQSITVNSGSTDGVRLGMTVVTPRGIVGRVIRVSPSTSRVLLITDPSSSVTAMIQKTRAKGVVNGQRRSFLSMKYIQQSEVIRTGDVVVTSGVGGLFPEGIMIGHVVDVSQRDVDVFKEARLEPEVDFASLDTVLVLTSHLPLNLE